MNEPGSPKSLRDYFELLVAIPIDEQESFLRGLEPALRAELQRLLRADADIRRRQESTDEPPNTEIFEISPNPLNNGPESCDAQTEIVIRDFAARLRMVPETGLEEFLYDPRVADEHRVQMFHRLLLTEREHRKEWNRAHPDAPLAVHYEGYWTRDFCNNAVYLLATIGVLILEHGYTLVKEIGRGGMGRVLLVQNTNLDNRLEALKVVLQKGTAGEWDEHRRRVFRERFERDVRALAQLTNEPNLAALYHNATADGLRFFTMAFVEGETLSEHVESHGPWKESHVVQRMAPLARLIHKFHTGPKLIHRDLHPANFIWSPKEARVFLIDFGLARSLEGSDLTDTGVCMGRRGFWAPEQARNAKDADERSDVFSFGATLYYLLTGQRPAKAGQPDTFPVDSPRLVNSNLSDAMECLCLRALEERPENRYQTMEELARELEGAPTQGLEKPSTHKVEELSTHKPTRRRWLIGATGLAAVTATGGGIWVFRQGRIRNKARVLRAEYLDRVLGARQADLWLPIQLIARREVEVYSHVQAVYACLKVPELSRDSQLELLEALALPFTSNDPIARRWEQVGEDGKQHPVGWLSRGQTEYTLADPIAWIAAGLAWAINRINSLKTPSDRERQLAVELEKHYATAVGMLRSFHPYSRNVANAPLGTWNMYFNQKDPTRHSTYTTMLILQALLETHNASLTFRLDGRTALNARMMEAVSTFLTGRYLKAAPATGWIAELDGQGQVDEGLTLQAYYLLLLCAQQYGVMSPAIADMLESMTSHALRFRERDVTFPSATRPLTTHLRDPGLQGGRELGEPREQTRFLWYPWLMALTAQLLQPKLGPRATENKQRPLRELLRYLVEDIGPRMKEIDFDEKWVFRSAEALIGLSAVEQVDF